MRSVSTIVACRYQSHIDLDLQEMKEHMERGDFEHAYHVFRLGAHADPYAILKLEDPITADFADYNHNRESSRLVAYGITETDEVVPLHVSASTHRGSTTLYVRYDDDSQCHVGARQDPITKGCLATKGGVIVQGYGAVNYYYDMDSDNQYWKTLYGFSEHEAESMFHCKDKCPYAEYEKFYHYYGQMDYGAIWMTAALKGHSTSEGGMSFTHGSEDFSSLGNVGRAAAVETAAITMNVRTHINRMLVEWAVDGCRKCEGGDRCPRALEAWDEAVAQYTGSLVQPNHEQPGGYDAGLLYYGLAEELCQDFGTCGINGDDIEGTASVNLMLMQSFRTGRIFLEKNTCDMAYMTYGEIIHRMTIPLIQGTLRSAYRLQKELSNEEEQGRAVAFMASILPDLASCSAADADIVYEQLNLGSLQAKSKPDFETIKAALERNYNCMKVTCKDVGGLLDETGEHYVNGGNPCGSRRARRGGSGKWRRSSTTFGWNQVVLVGSAALVAVVMTIHRRRWIPALSSQADVVLSKLAGPGRHGRYHQVHSDYSPYSSGAIELDASSSTYDQDLSESSADYHEDGFDLSLRSTSGSGPTPGLQHSDSL